MTLCINVTGHVDEYNFYHNMVLILPSPPTTLGDLVRAIETKAAFDGMPPFRVGTVDVHDPVANAWRRVVEVRDVINGCFLYATPHEVCVATLMTPPTTTGTPHSSSLTSIASSKHMFQGLDQTGKGFLDFKETLRMLPAHLDVVVDLFNSADTNYDGVVDRAEFAAFCDAFPAKARNLSDALVGSGALQKKEIWVVPESAQRASPSPLAFFSPSPLRTSERFAHRELVREMGTLRTTLDSFYQHTPMMHYKSEGTTLDSFYAAEGGVDYSPVCTRDAPSPTNAATARASDMAALRDSENLLKRVAMMDRKIPPWDEL